MKVLSKLLALAVFVAALSAPANAALSITAHLINENASGGAAGQCPQTYNFTGTINAAGWIAGSHRIVTYRFEKSDGTIEKTHQWTAPAAPGSKQVVDSWTLGGTSDRWEVLHVLTPIDVVSEKSHVHPHCPGT
jgi:hypothetical protein